MRLSFLSSILKKNKKTLKTPESIILKQIKKSAHENKFFVYENVTIYHYSKKALIPLIILDPERGLYIFENKEYSYDDLNNPKTTNIAENDLSSEYSFKLIQEKLNEMLEGNSIPIFSFYLMPQLNSYDYEHLNSSIQKLFPFEKIMFNDLSKKDVLTKIQEIDKVAHKLPKSDTIIGNLIVQYLILDNSDNVNIATLEQKKFIDTDFSSLEYLCGESKSGRTEATLLKVISQKLKNPDLKITIIKPTTLSCDLTKRKLLRLIERALIDVDIASIEIITPLDLLQQHLQKLNKRTIGDEAYLSNMLINKDFNIADVIICDDSDTMSKEFIKYLRHTQKKSNLLVISSENIFHKDYVFNKVFKPDNKKVIFEKTNPHARVFHIVSSLLKDYDAKDILIVSSTATQEKLNYDLRSYTNKKIELIDSSKKLLFKDNDSIMLSTYAQTNSLEAKFVILLDICFADEKELKYAYNLAYNTVYVLYRGKSDNLAKLRKHFEDNQN